LFSFDRDETEIKRETLDDQLNILQIQDRAKLLLVYNKELNKRMETA
jgi:hypothetical protein